MFIPFYIPGRDRLRVVIIGGGYAGFAALATIKEHRPDAEITLIDPRTDHLKITLLHESFRRPVSDFHLPFRTLETRFDIQHKVAAPDLSDLNLAQWNSDRAMVLDGDIIDFDYLVVATGADLGRFDKTERMLDLEDFAKISGPDLLNERLEGSGSGERFITVVGGGATGIQFLFEIAQFIRDRHLPWRLRLVDGEEAVLREFHPALGRYAAARMEDWGIEFLRGRFFKGQSDASIQLERRASGELEEQPSHLSLLFIGRTSSGGFDANAFGQIVADGQTLDRCFTAGDCSRYRAPGSNALSAQAALRKGKLVARNILRHSGRLKLLEPYIHRDLGYVVSLGPNDAVGWLGLKRNVVGGAPAAAVKDIVEAQYDLLLAGVDTYII